MRKHLLLVAVLLVFSCAAPAFANSSIPPMTDIYGSVLWAAILPVIFAEGFVLYRLLDLSFFRSLEISSLMNIFSTFIGLIIMVVAEPVVHHHFNFSLVDGYGALIFMALITPFFITSIFAEYPIIKKYNKKIEIKKIRKAAFLSNLLSYSSLTLFWIIYLSQKDFLLDFYL